MKLLNTISQRIRTPVVAMSLVCLGTPTYGIDEPSGMELYKAGRIQEAAWQFAVEGDREKSNQVHEEIELLLSTSPLDGDQTKPSDDLRGITDAFRVYFRGTTVSAIFKEHEDSSGVDQEVSAYRLSRKLRFDFVPVVVRRTIEVDGTSFSGSLMYWVENAKTAKGAGLRAADKPDKLVLFDAVIGNIDRHRGNWMVTSMGMIFAIDHNMTFDYDIDQLDRLSERKPLNAKKELSLLRNLERPQLDAILKGFEKKTQQVAWQRVQDIIKRTGPRPDMVSDVQLTKRAAGKFVLFQLTGPLSSHPPGVKEILLGIVKGHMPPRGAGDREDGYDPERRIGTNGATWAELRVYREDATRIQIVLEGFGFKVLPACQQ